MSTALESVQSVLEFATTSKKQKPKRSIGVNTFESLKNRLFQIRKDLHEQARETGGVIEVEARLGMIVDEKYNGRTGPFTPGAGAIEFLSANMTGKKFVSGVSEKHFLEYERFLQEHTLESQIIRSTKDTFIYKNGHRVERLENGERVAEKKRKEVEFQLHLPACPYDLRMTVSIETPTDLSASTCQGDEWESCRQKKRTSFRGTRLSNNEPCWWQADLTRVATKINEVSGGGGDDGEGQVTYEVELELGQKETTSWVETLDAEPAAKLTAQVAQQIWEQLSLLMPPEKTASSLKEIIDSGVHKAAKHAALRPFQPDITLDRVDTMEFPGTMPVGFSRRALKKVLQQKYMVSEKTDGVRYFLVAVEHEGKVVGALLDRKFKAFTMQGLDEAAASLGAGTVLDGEVVRNRSWNRDVFIAFDVIACSNVCHPSKQWSSVVGEQFLQRLNILQKNVLSNGYKRVNGDVNRDMKALPLIMKIFHPVEAVGEVLRHIRSEGPARVYLERDKQTGKPFDARKRHHKSDGLIFVATRSSYVRGTDQGYFKWKWPDSITLDFLVSVPHPGIIKVSFPAQSCDGVDFTEHVTLGEHERYRLLGDLYADCVGGRLPAGLVGEWEYDPEASAFRYKMPRPDKKKANFSTTVHSTIMELAEGLRIEELQYRLTHKGKVDDWAGQMDKFCRQLLETR